VGLLVVAGLLAVDLLAVDLLVVADLLATALLVVADLLAMHIGKLQCIVLTSHRTVTV